MNAEFQRISRRDKKVFHRDQCKDIEENNRMGNIRYLFKKVRDTKGIIFHAKMGAVRERNDMNLTEAGDTKKRCVNNTHKNSTKIKKIFTTKIITMVCSLT